MESKKNYTATLLLSFFLGGLGIHRFYTGYIGLGILQLLTAGGCGIWTLIDFINICFGNFKAADGQALDEYNPTLGKTFFFVCVALCLLSVIMYATALAEIFRGVQEVSYVN